MTQRFGADPYALVYEGRVYLYMTGDTFIRDENGEVMENVYSQIDRINVISSEDLVNWTDHGTVYAAGANGAAPWGKNSWAPAAACKEIDGVMKFFLYFANGGTGIAVLEADSPTGPFTDRLGKPLISRQTPACSDVTWLFDPAVLVDDDGEAYLYFGGGLPNADMAANPGINGRYYYSYCSNFSIPEEQVSSLGFDKGEILVMTSTNPMGPFELVGPILKNPGWFFGLEGNNHHCMFQFMDQWYMAYHTRILEERMGILQNYRSTSIDSVQIDGNGRISSIQATREGVAQTQPFYPYCKHKAVTMAAMGGITTTQYGEDAVKYGSGEMLLTGISDGSWIQLCGVDFGEKMVQCLEMTVRGTQGGCVKAYLDSPHGTCLCETALIPGDTQEFTVCKGIVNRRLNGIHDLYFVFQGEGYEVYDWRFV